MTKYAPGAYDFKIAVSDPKRQEDSFLYAGPWTVHRRRSEAEIADDILASAQNKFPDQAVLRLRTRKYKLTLTLR